MNELHAHRSIKFGMVKVAAKKRATRASALWLVLRDALVEIGFRLFSCNKSFRVWRLRHEHYPSIG